MAKLSDLANKFFELRQEKSKLTELLKATQKALDSVEREFLEELSHEGMDRLDLKGKGSFFISNRTFYKITDRESFIDFIHEQGDTDLLTVQHQTLNAYAKEMYSRNEGIEEFEIPGIECTKKPGIRMRKNGSNPESESDEE